MWIAERGKDLEFSRLVDPNTTALIVIDVQNDFCHPDGAFGRAGHDTSPMPALATRLQKLLAEARARQILTIFVRATYDLEVTSRALAQNRYRRGLVHSLCLEGTWGAEWFAGVVPSDAPNEVVMTKHRFDAFQGTPLDLYLRNNGIRTVVVTGVATSGCVESTVRDAFFQDYSVVIPRDGVAEAGQVYHEQSLAVMKRAFATVTEVDDVINAWRQCTARIEPSWRAAARRRRADEDMSAEGLVLVDVEALEAGQAALVRELAAAARAAAVPIFDVRSLDVPLGRSSWSDGEGPAEGKELTGASSPAEMPVGKMRRSGFAGTRLGLLLRTNEVRHVTVAGADVIPGSLAATILDALDADYAVTLAADACADAEWTAVARAGARISSAADVRERWRGRISKETERRRA